MELKPNKKWDKIYIFSFGLILLFLAIYIWLHLTKSVNFIDSDASGDMLYAQFLASQHTWISSGWYFTTELRLIYTQLLTAPLFSVLSDWTVIRAIATTVFCLLLVFSYGYMMRAFQVAYKWIWFTAPLLLMPTSVMILQRVPLDLEYAPYIIITFFYVGLFFRVTKKETRGMLQTVILYILFVFFSFYLGLAGMRYFMSAVIPLFLVCIWMVLRSDEFKLFRKDANANTWKNVAHTNAFRKFLYAAGGLVLACGGYLVNDKILLHIFSFNSYTDHQFIDFTTRPILERLSGQVSDLLQLFGYTGDRPVLSAPGLVNLVSIFVFIFIIILTVKVFKRMPKSCTDEQQPIVLFAIATFVFNSFIFLFTQYISWHYIPTIVFYVPVLAVYFNMKHFKFNAILAAVLIFGSIFTLSVYSIKSVADVNMNEKRYPAIWYLLKNNYDFGYSTFWDAMVTTEMSQDKVQVAPITDFNTMQPYDWNTQKAFFQEGYHDGKSFVLLTEDERNQYANSGYLKEGKLTFDDGNYAVYTFASNVDLEKAVAANNK